MASVGKKLKYILDLCGGTICNGLCTYISTCLFTYTGAVEPPTNVMATVLTPLSVEVTWTAECHF